MTGVDAHLSDLQNRAAAGIFQRFQNTELCSAGIGAVPQQAETPHFHFRRNEGGGFRGHGSIACHYYTKFGITASIRNSGY